MSRNQPKLLPVIITACLVVFGCGEETTPLTPNPNFNTQPPATPAPATGASWDAVKNYLQQQGTGNFLISVASATSATKTINMLTSLENGSNGLRLKLFSKVANSKFEAEAYGVEVAIQNANPVVGMQTVSLADTFHYHASRTSDQISIDMLSLTVDQGNAEVLSVQTGASPQGKNVYDIIFYFHQRDAQGQEMTYYGRGSFGDMVSI